LQLGGEIYFCYFLSTTSYYLSFEYLSCISFLFPLLFFLHLLFPTNHLPIYPNTALRTCSRALTCASAFFFIFIFIFFFFSRYLLLTVFENAFLHSSSILFITSSPAHIIQPSPTNYTSTAPRTCSRALTSASSCACLSFSLLVMLHTSYCKATHLVLIFFLSPLPSLSLFFFTRCPPDYPIHLHLSTYLPISTSTAPRTCPREPTSASTCASCCSKSPPCTGGT
jgi:hypothetical protein